MSFVKDNTKLLLFGQFSERLEFKKLGLEEFPQWLKFCQDEYSLQYIWPQQDKSTEEKCQIWFDRVFHRYENNLGGMNALYTKETNQFIGQCGLLVQTLEAKEVLEIGYSLMPEARGRGYALEAAKKCQDYAFQNNLTEYLISIIHIHNIPSQNVAQKNGMKIEKTIIYHEMPVHIFSISKKEWLDKWNTTTIK